MYVGGYSLTVIVFSKLVWYVVRIDLPYVRPSSNTIL